MDDSAFEVLPAPIKSESDKKDYKIIKLQNGLVACLISDKAPVVKENDATQESSDNLSATPDTGSEATSENKVTDEKMAAAGLSIRVGSFSDPKEVQGMSHFLEHMVFMGSEKYPAENDFFSFINKRGGSTNAFTELEVTEFYFKCLEKHLHGAVDRWSQFFISPLLKKEAMSREREAVDSEFHMSLPYDSVRKEQLLLNLSKPQSPANCFPCGNLKTLKENISDEQLYEDVHAHRKTHYSAHRMTLAIQARLPMQTIENLVMEFFSKIPNNELPKDDFSVFANGLFDTPEFNRLYYVKPMHEVIELNLNWMLPSLQTKYKSKPIDYLCYLLEDESKGSLLSYLKKHMWVVSLRAISCNSNSLYTSFNIIADLTEEGVKRKFDVIEAVFSYINLLKTVGPQERIFEDLTLIADTLFKFDPEYSSSCTVTSLCSNMLLYPPEHIITGPRIFYEYDPDTISMIMNHLIPNNMNIMVVIKDLTDGLTFSKTEKWFGTDYVDVEIPEELKIQWETIEPYREFNIPPPNPYLTNNFEILSEVSEHPDYPQKLIDNSKCELWYRKDQKFKLPMAHYQFYLISTSSVESPKTMIMLDMLVDLLNFAIAEETYPAGKASLYIRCTNCLEKGMSFEVSGYNEKLPMLVDLIVKYIKNLKQSVNKKMFLGLKEAALKCNFNNILEPSSLCYDLHYKLLLNNLYTPLDTYNELARLTYSDMLQFIEEYGKYLYVKVLVQGNVLPQVATDTVYKFLDSMEFDEIPRETYPQFNMPQIPAGEKCLLVESFHEKDPNCITLNYYQVGPFSLRNGVILDIIMLMIQEPLFSTLRTTEQLGYDVYCYKIENFGILGFVLAVNAQETKFTTQYLDSRIEEFLKKSKQIIEETTEEQFQTIKEDLIKTKECCDHNLEEEVCNNWREITDEYYMFDRKKLEVETFKIITLDDVAIFWNKHNRFGSPETFRKISYQVVGHVSDDNTDTSQEENSENKTDIKDTTLKILGNNKENLIEGKDLDYFIEDIDKFKDKLCGFPVKD